MSEKLCLKWNDFQENLNSAFGILREDNAFTDVTLACVDGKQLEAHKVILAASSPFFEKLLKRNKHLHPLIFMRGLQYEDLVAVVDFLYLGEAMVFQEHLDSFLAIANELQLKGLMKDQPAEQNHPIGSKETPPFQNHLKDETVFKKKPRIQKSSEQGNASNDTSDVKTLALESDFVGYLHELDERVRSMMEKSQNVISYGKDNQQKRIADRCKVCGKEGHTVNIREHIEVNHLDGVAIPCNLCGQTFRSSRSMKSHQALWHKY